MTSLNVTFVDSRDSLGINRFNQHPGPTRELHWSWKHFWYWNYQVYTSTKKVRGFFHFFIITNTHKQKICTKILNISSWQDEASVGCCSNVYISYHYITPVMMHYFQFLTKKVSPVDTSLTLWSDKEALENSPTKKD
jgi:hypothetical protein